MSKPKGSKSIPRSVMENLAALYATGDYTTAQAAAECKVDCSTVWRWRETMPWFAALWERALAERVSDLEDIGWQRARGRVKEIRDPDGKVIDRKYEVSDVLLMFMLKAANRKKYAERYYPVPNEDSETVEGMLERIARERGLADDDAPSKPN